MKSPCRVRALSIRAELLYVADLACGERHFQILVEIDFLGANLGGSLVLSKIGDDLILGHSQVNVLGRRRRLVGRRRRRSDRRRSRIGSLLGRGSSGRSGRGRGGGLLGVRVGVVRWLDLEY